jgi:hypothetical protein
MKKFLLFFVGLTFITGLLAIAPQGFDMLILNRYDFSQEEITASLDSQRAVYEDWLTHPELYSKGQAGLFVLDLFAMRDTVTNAAEFQMEIILDMLFEVAYLSNYIGISLDSIFMDVENQYDLIDNLYAYMTEGMADSLVLMLNDIPIHFEERVELTKVHLEATLNKMMEIAGMAGTKFEDIVENGEAFEFRIARVERWYDGFSGYHNDTSLVAVLYHDSFLSINAAIGYMEHALHYLDIGMGHIFDWGYGNVNYGIDTLILAMQSLQSVCDTLDNYSIWSIVDSSWTIPIDEYTELEIGFKDIEAVFGEIEAMLSGKVYSIEDLDIRPVGIIENLHYGLYRTYIDVYWQEDPYVYTFRDIFPNGLPADFIGQILPEMVIDPRYDRAQLENYFMTLAGGYAARLFSDPNDVKANTGIGYILLSDMLMDVADQGEMIAALVDGGRVDSLFMNYDWDNLDYSDEIALIRNHLDHHYRAYNDKNYVVYTVLVKDPNRSSPGTTVAEGDLVYPVYIIPQVTNGIVQVTYFVENAFVAIKNGLEHIYDEVSRMIDISLDPNYLNLSNIEEPLDLIYALEAANPNFLAFTPEGKLAFAEFGDSLAVGMWHLANLADTVVATMEYAELLMYEFGMSEEVYDTMMMNLFQGSYMMRMMANDLAIPDAYTIINEENVNLSAWFDNVPDNLLTVMKNYFEGTDPSMAGFFPDRLPQNVSDPEILPQTFALKGNYPNPFNPVTHISFDLPHEDMVSLAIYNITGRKVADLIDRKVMSAGSYDLTWNAAHHATGLYIVRMQYGNTQAYHKMTLLK